MGRLDSLVAPDTTEADRARLALWERDAGTPLTVPETEAGERDLQRNPGVVCGRVEDGRRRLPTTRRARRASTRVSVTTARPSRRTSPDDRARLSASPARAFCVHVLVDLLHYRPACPAGGRGRGRTFLRGRVQDETPNGSWSSRCPSCRWRRPRRHARAGRVSSALRRRRPHRYRRLRCSAPAVLPASIVFADGPTLTVPRARRQSRRLTPATQSAQAPNDPRRKSENRHRRRVEQKSKADTKIRFEADPIGDGALLLGTVGFASLSELVLSTGEIRPQKQDRRESSTRRNLPADRPRRYPSTSIPTRLATSNIGLLSSIGFALLDPVLTGFRDGSEAGIVDAFMYAEAATTAWELWTRWRWR